MARDETSARGGGARRAALIARIEERFPTVVAAPLRWLLSIPFWVLGVALLLVVGSAVSLDALAEVPEGLIVKNAVSSGIDRAADWVVVAWDPFFSFINDVLLQYLLLPLERWLLSLPWWLTVVVVTLIAYKRVGWKFAPVALALMLLTVVFGLYDLTMATLALVLTSTLISVVLGVPLGILAAQSRRFETALRPMLDAMQTMPSFVYLIPILLLFGLGKVPAVIATCVYAAPPVIRLTNLGIRQVDREVVEAAHAFGSTRRQILFKVQIPLALPTIMAGLNQTIMMALAMVVIASMIGARGLGIEVLQGINRLEVGRGLVAGVGIVIMAIILDRVTQSFGKPTGTAVTAG